MQTGRCAKRLSFSRKLNDGQTDEGNRHRLLPPRHVTLSHVNPSRALALVCDPSLILHDQGITPDPWQRDLLLSRDAYLLLNCARQTGKSTTVAAIALHRLLTEPG